MSNDSLNKKRICFREALTKRLDPHLDGCRVGFAWGGEDTTMGSARERRFISLTNK